MLLQSHHQIKFIRLYCRRVSHYLLENGGDGQMTPLLRLGSGACAGIIGMTATYPLDMVRGRLTVQAGKEYTGILHATRMIVKQVCDKQEPAPHALLRGKSRLGSLCCVLCAILAFSMQHIGSARHSLSINKAT